MSSHIGGETLYVPFIFITVEKEKENSENSKLVLSTSSYCEAL